MHAETKFATLSDQGFEPEFGRYSWRIWVVLSIVMSLATTAIFVKYEMVGPPIIPFLLIPVALTLCFKDRIAKLPPWVYAGTLVVVLSAAVIFGL
jgi:hypothetical protein